MAVTKNIGRKDIIDKPAEFFEGMRGIYGEAGTVVFEYMLAREIKREFGVTGEVDNETIKESARNLLRLIAEVRKGIKGESSGRTRGFVSDAEKEEGPR